MFYGQFIFFPENIFLITNLIKLNLQNSVHNSPILPNFFALSRGVSWSKNKTLKQNNESKKKY